MHGPVRGVFVWARDWSLVIGMVLAIIAFCVLAGFVAYVKFAAYWNVAFGL